MYKKSVKVKLGSFVTTITDIEVKYNERMEPVIGIYLEVSNSKTTSLNKTILKDMKAMGVNLRKESKGIKDFGFSVPAKNEHLFILNNYAPTPQLEYLKHFLNDIGCPFALLSSEEERKDFESTIQDMVIGAKLSAEWVDWQDFKGTSFGAGPEGNTVSIASAKSFQEIINNNFVANDSIEIVDSIVDAIERNPIKNNNMHYIVRLDDNDGQFHSISTAMPKIQAEAYINDWKGYKPTMTLVSN